MSRRRAVQYVVVAGLAVGMWIAWPHEIFSHNPTTTTVLFNREIVSVLQEKCLQCHSDGKMGMSLATYADARPWAVAIKEEVLGRRMPPWPAEAGYGDFAHDIGLTARELDFLVSWVEGGAPEGELDPPPFVDHSGHWMLGEPQAIAVAGEGVRVKAGSPPQLTRLELHSGLARETWVRAFDFQPGDARVVRAAFFTVVETGDYLGGWTPWSSGTELPAGVGFRLPAQARIAVDVLYSGTVEDVVDRPRLALYAAAGRPLVRATSTTLRTSTSSAGAHPTAAGWRLSGRLGLSNATALLSLRPQVPVPGASVAVTAIRPDGSREALLYVKDFRPEWQAPFTFRRPVALPGGSVLEATAYYDDVPNGSSVPPFAVTVTTHDDIPPRMALVPAHEPASGRPADSTSAGALAWFCPMHPDVTAAESGYCRKCGMALVVGRPFDTRDYPIDVQVTPAAVRAGERVEMRFDVRHPSSGGRVRDFELVHDRRYHLFVISHDMNEFQHLHPVQEGDGTWSVETTFPRGGVYRVVSDFLPTGGAPQFLVRTVVTADFEGDLRLQDARLEPDTTLKKTAGPLTAELKFDPPRLVAGQYGHLEFTLTDSRTGEPVTDLEPYLGAFGHAFVLSEDLRDSVHSHPPEWRDGREIAEGRGGPTVLFEGYMPRPGRYRVWAQFLRQGDLTTIPFTFDVSTLDEVFGPR